MMVHCVPMSGLIESRKLYSTLRVSLLEKEGGEAAEALYDYAVCYEQDITKTMDGFRTERFPTNDLMRYFSLPHKQLEAAIRSKVLSAHPTVHAEGKVLYAVLELTMTRDLTVEELRAFSEQIACQYNIGWGGQLEYCDIKARNADVISVRLYHDDITFFTGTAFERQIDRERARRMSKNKPER